MSFDPTKLGQPAVASKSRGPRPERLFVVVEQYDTPQNDFAFAVGHLLGDEQAKVRVRLNTVDERVQDQPKADRAKVEALYMTAENKRDTLADKSKAGISLLSFDDARKISSDEDGAAVYRAHWPKPMATAPGAEPLVGFAHVRLREAITDRDGVHKLAVAQIELLKSNTVVDKTNVKDILSAALATKDDQGRARDPFAIIRVIHNDEVVASPRIYPVTEQTQVFQQATGTFKDVNKPADATKTIEYLASGSAGKSDTDNQRLDIIRAALAGVSGEPEPTFNSPDKVVRDNARNYYFGARDGHLEIEVISAETIDFGAATRKTYLKDKEKPQFFAYTIKESVNDNKVRASAAFTRTALAVHRHPDGEPYAVFASPTEMYPESLKVTQLPAGVRPGADKKLDTSLSNEESHSAPQGQAADKPDAVRRQEEEETPSL